ncbi:MAG TPA: S8 family serine peptidase [Xanthobacteraceae bacterium]
MRSDRELAQRKLLLSAAVVALIVAAPAGTSALAMNLGSGIAGVHAIGPVSTGVYIPRGNPGGGTVGVGGVSGGAVSGGAISGGAFNNGAIGAARGIGNIRGVVVNPCLRSRRNNNPDRCGKVVVNNGGDGPGNGNGDGEPHGPRHPIWTHPPHWIVPVQPIVPTNPVIVTTQPVVTGGSQPPGGQGPQALRRGGSGVPAANERRYVPDEVVVELANSTTNQQTDALGRRYRLARLQSVPFQLGGTTLVRWHITDRRSVPVVVRELENDGLSAQPNYLFVLQDGAAKPAAASEGDPAQYMLEKMHLPQAHGLAQGNRVLVAVIDSGVDVTHPDLAGDIAGSYDALGTGFKAHSHGTAIAGAIAAHGRLMGAAPSAQILAVRAFSGNGAEDGTDFAIRTGLDWAVSHGARIVNMSFAGPQDPGIARAVAQAHDKGVILIAAAGNRGAKSPPLYPAADPNVIAVTATDTNDQMPAFANRGPYIAVAAPGVDLMLLAPNGTLQVSSGTSFSAAYVTGTAALMLERKPDLGPETLRQALTGTAHHLVPSPFDKAADNQSGAGLVDAYQAVLSLAPAPVDAASVMQVSAPR